MLVTPEIDGLPQRVLRNELIAKLENAGSATRLLRALRSALQYRRATGAALSEHLRSGLAMRRREGLTRANAPRLARKAMLDGDPVNGYLPSGSVAGMIDDRPGCAELVEAIVNEAEQTLKALTH